MTIQLVNGGLWIPNSAPFVNAALTFSGLALNAAASRIAWVFQVPKSGTLDWFEFRMSTNSNTPDNGVRLSFQGLDAAGRPDNVEDEYTIITAGFASNTWMVPPSYMGAGGPGTGAKRVVTKGDWIACCLRFENFVASDNITISGISIDSKTGVNGQLNTYVATSTSSGATWTTTNTSPINIALKYSDGTYAVLDWPHIPASASNSRIFNSGSTPDERGLLFQVPFPCRLSSVWARVDSDGAFDIVLYDAASSVVISETIAHLNVFGTAGANGQYMLTTPQPLTKNVNYRLAFKPTTVTSITIYDVDFNSSVIRATNPGGSTWKSTSRTDAGAWTDVDTNLPIMGLVFDGFDDATGGGGGGGEHSAVF
jgi:hypothetical protein